MIPLKETYRNEKLRMFEERLLPCPFCGNKAQIQMEHSNENDLYCMYVFCDKCGCRQAPVAASKEATLNNDGILQVSSIESPKNVIEVVTASWNKRNEVNK